MTPLRPIPEVEDADASAIGVVECGEPLVALVSEARIRLAPAYHRLGISGASSRIHLRAGALLSLRRAAERLPDGLSFLIWDGLRTLSTQREIGRRFHEQLRDRDLDPDERRRLVSQYVTPPPSSLPDFRQAPPPHSTGGAIDLGLCDSNGRAVDLGAEFDQFDESAWLRHFETGLGSGDDAATKSAREHRRILFWAMIGAGFAPYPWEYWHFEIGTRREAAYNGRAFATYGPATHWTEEEIHHAA
jgi:zinc D-Ala-D-Ala dipeptidase